MGSPPAIRLVVPGDLQYRDLAIRTVAEACRIVSRSLPEDAGQDGGARLEKSIDCLDLSHPFDAEVVSAFSEIFNNIALYSYSDGRKGDIDLSIYIESDSLSMTIEDQGQSFDIDTVPAPELEALPDSGMGIHIARAFVDELEYEAGPPNVWRLTKRASASPANDRSEQMRDAE